MPGPASSEQPSSLRAEQVAQTRAALVAAGRRLFGENGFRGTSVEDLAREARVTTGALVSPLPHQDSAFRGGLRAGAHGLDGGIDRGGRWARRTGSTSWQLGFDAFLDGVLQPDVQRILVLDGPAVLGLARYTELDEQYAHAVIVHSLTAAAKAGTIQIDDPETATRLLLGALTRGAMLIANSPNPVKTRHAVAKSMRALLNSFTVP